MESLWGFKEEAQASASNGMGFIGWLIRFVFWVLIVSWVIKLVGRLFSGAFAGSGHRDAAPSAPSNLGQDAARKSKRLVKDPVCGLHMAEELALPLSANGETQYFCSQECRAKYESSVLRRAANS
jgi:YHS domain-containing protein